MADDNIDDPGKSASDPAGDLRRLRLDRSSASLDAEEELLLARQQQLAKLREQIERTQQDQRSELSRIEEARDQLNHLASEVENRRAEVDDYRAKLAEAENEVNERRISCLLYTSPSPRDQRGSRMPSSA